LPLTEYANVVHVVQDSADHAQRETHMSKTNAVDYGQQRSADHTHRAVIDCEVAGGSPSDIRFAKVLSRLRQQALETRHSVPLFSIAVAPNLGMNARKYDWIASDQRI